MSASKTILITPGDPDGIGPEVVWKTLKKRAFWKGKKSIHLVCVGASKPFKSVRASFDKIPISFIEAPTRALKGQHLGGYQSGWSIEKAVTLLQSDPSFSALVTGPISKEHLQKGGYPYRGHTDFLAALCGTKKKTKDVTMMMANDRLRVSLVTTHLPLKDVARKIRRSEIARTVLQTFEYLHRFEKISKPKIAVMGLNPHAGENGILGKEEMRLITPTIRSLQKKLKGKARITGPHPSDTYFAKQISAPLKEKDHATVCMYHDQGLIPVKLIDFSRTVNVTLGLPFVRTSVDHGVAFDIAGKNRADPSSFEAALEMAIRFG